MFSKLILKNCSLMQTERVYMKKVPEKTLNFLQQFMMIAYLEVYSVGWDSQITEIGMNYTLKEKMGYDPVINGNNDPFRWAKIISITDWLELYLTKQIDLTKKNSLLKVFNQPGIDEPDGIVARFTGHTKILGNIEDADGFAAVALPYTEFYSEGEHVYKRLYIVIVSHADYGSILEGSYFYSGSGSD